MAISPAHGCCSTNWAEPPPICPASCTTAGSPSKTCKSGNTKTATGAGTLVGIGRDKAAKIWYRALTVYMTSSTVYAGARTATINAATDLDRKSVV